MNRSMTGLPVHHQLLEFTQTHVHWVSDAIQLSHPLSSPSSPALNLAQHQGLFQWVSSSHQVAKVLEFQLQHQSHQWTPKTDLLQNGLVGSPCSPRDSQESSTPQFKSINSSALSFLYSPTLTSIQNQTPSVSLVKVCSLRFALKLSFTSTNCNYPSQQNSISENFTCYSVASIWNIFLISLRIVSYLCTTRFPFWTCLLPEFSWPPGEDVSQQPQMW